MSALSVTLKTKFMIDDLKSVCVAYGMQNTASEYKIITEIFLYKFLNDKFIYEMKKVNLAYAQLSDKEV